MKSVGLLLIFLLGAAVLAMSLVALTNLSLIFAGSIALVLALVVYLMLDLRPDPNPGDKTIIRLTRGNWHRKRK